jgi:UrcA family protein
MAKFSLRAATGALLVSVFAFSALDARAADISETVITAADGVRRQAVNYGDLNLATQRGVETLYRRIARAADNVCGTDYGRQPLEQTLNARRCRDNAVKAAIVEVDRPELSAHFASLQERGARS